MVLDIETLAERFGKEGYPEAEERLRNFAQSLKEEDLIPDTLEDTSISIAALFLSTRARNALARAHIGFVEELRTIPDDELLHIKNLGHESVALIRSRIEGLDRGEDLQTRLVQEHSGRKTPERLDMNSLVGKVVPVWRMLGGGIKLDDLRENLSPRYGKPPIPDPSREWTELKHKLTTTEKIYIISTFGNLLEIKPYTVEDLRKADIEDLSITSFGSKRTEKRIVFLNALLNPQ